MSSRQKRSNGGYGLRRKVAKKRLDEDFEYYFSKVGSCFESKTGKDENRAIQEVYISEVKPSEKVNMKNVESPEKRPRGRPRKIHIPVQEPDISDANLKFVALKEKRCRKSKIPIDDHNDSSKVVEEISEKIDIVSNVACEEEVENDCDDKRLKLDAILSEEITELREEEVSSIPEGEKENLQEEGVSLDSYSEERIIVPIGVEVEYDGEEVELFDGDIGEKGFAFIQKSKRKYRRNRLNSETIRRLSQLSPDDKIECNECHKLLKPSSFRQHLRTHTGEKPFGCEVCEARFTRKGDVERHVRIVHNKQKPFKCCRCQRAFGDKKNLRWHLMNHDKKLFYVCEVCGFKFGKREYWENHVRYIHPLPGGIDPSEAGADDVDDERLQALTDSLLEDESADEPCQDNDSYEGDANENDMNFITADIEEPVECRVIKREATTIPFKCLPNVVKVSNCKEGEIIDNSNVRVANNQMPEVDAVVIQINDTPEDEIKRGSPGKEPARLCPTNIIRVVTPSNTEHFSPDSIDHDGRIVIDTREETVVEGDQVLEPVVQVFMPEETANEVDTISMNREPSKVISIVFNEEEDDKRRGNVRSLIEALLDAAHGQKKISEVSEKLSD